MNGDWMDSARAFGFESRDAPRISFNIGNHELLPEFRDRVLDENSRNDAIFWTALYYHRCSLCRYQQAAARHAFHAKLQVDSLTLGFLYKLVGFANESITVQVVQEIVSQEAWFRQTVSVENDAILVPTRTHGRDGSTRDRYFYPQYATCCCWREATTHHARVQFSTGSVTFAPFSSWTVASASIEAGKYYLDTMGFISTPSKQTL
jgi:hypothetical protein